MAIGRVDLDRLRWRCRRGFLENDLVLERFLQRHAGALDETRLAALNELLALPDPDLGQRECLEPRLAPIVAMLSEG